jgi:predicted NBD/HSP70 family sugar kinase
MTATVAVRARSKAPAATPPETRRQAYGASQPPPTAPGGRGVSERALDHSDQLAGERVHRAVQALGTGIASAVNLLDPEAVTLGGGLGDRLGARYADAIQSEMARHLFVDENPPDFRLAELGDFGGRHRCVLDAPTPGHRAAGGSGPQRDIATRPMPNVITWPEPRAMGSESSARRSKERPRRTATLGATERVISALRRLTDDGSATRPSVIEPPLRIHPVLRRMLE